MKLYSGPLSLFARKVEIALLEKQLPFECVMVAFSQTAGYSPKHPDVLAANPKGQVPVLTDGDLTLFDSTLILEYLEDAYPKPPLYPQSPVERARCRLLELYADEIMLMPLRLLMHRNTPGERDEGQWAAKESKAKDAEKELDRQFSDLEARLGDEEYLCGSFTAADISVFMMMLYTLRLGGPALDNHPALGRWYRRLLQRPAFSAVVSEILAVDKELSAPVDKAFGGGAWLPSAAL
jgi:glutathione S-transferase